jgi:hypothetical protein
MSRRIAISIRHRTASTALRCRQHSAALSPSHPSRHYRMGWHIRKHRAVPRRFTVTLLSANYANARIADVNRDSES